MTIFTVLPTGYRILLVKPEIFNVEFRLEMAIAIIPIMMLVLATIDCITLNGKNFYKKVGINLSMYIFIYCIEYSQ